MVEEMRMLRGIFKVVFLIALFTSTSYAFPQNSGGQVTATATSAAVLTDGTIDVTNYKSLSVQLSGTWVGTNTFQGSNDGTNYVSVKVVDVATGLTSTTSTANGLFYVPINFKYFRVNATAYTSGTITATIDLNYTPSFMTVLDGGAVTNAGTFAVQITGSALTSLQLLDDSTGTVGSAVPTKAQVAGGTDGTNSRILKTDSSGELQVDVLSLPAGTNLLGKISSSQETSTMYDGTTALTPKFVAISASSSGNNTILAAVTSKKIRVLGMYLISNGTVNAKFQSGASGTDLTGLGYLIANAGWVLPYSPIGWFETASNTLLNLNLSGAIAVGGALVYVEV